MTVGGVVAVAEIGTVWAVVLAGAVLVAATVAMAVVVEGFLADDDDADPRPVRARMRWPALAVVAVTAAALVVALVAPRHDDVAAATSSGTTAGATETVRAFLVAAYVDGDGDAACGYLSLGEQDRLAASEPSGACSDAVDNPAGPPQLAALTSSAQVRALPADVQLSGGTATVRVGGVVFLLRPATGAEESQFAAPASHWRITSGVSAPAQAAS
jgi:hypothetical protein